MSVIIKLTNRVLIFCAERPEEVDVSVQYLEPQALSGFLGEVQRVSTAEGDGGLQPLTCHCDLQVRVVNKTHRQVPLP